MKNESIIKILFLRTYFPPEETSSPYISNNLLNEYASKGWEMLVYTPIPSRNISCEVRSRYKKEGREELAYNGRLIIKRFSLFKEKNNGIMRFFRYFCQNLIEWWKTIWNKEAREKDVLVVSSTPPTQGAMAALIKIFTGLPVVYLLQDIFPDSLVGANLARKDGLLWKIGRKIENFTYKHADKIIVIGESFKQNLLEKGVPEEKIEVVYNWADDSLFYPIPLEKNTFFEEFDVDKNKFNIVYAGNLGQAQNIDVIIEAANLLRENETIAFHIFGSCGLETDLKEKAKRLNLTNLKFYPLQPLEKAAQVYNLADVCIVSCKKGFGGIAMPSKTVAIMSCGKAIIASFDEGELSQLLSQNNCGIPVSPNDSKALADAIEKLSKERDKCQVMGQNGLKLVKEKFSKEYGTSRYVEIIEDVVENHKHKIKKHKIQSNNI